MNNMPKTKIGIVAVSRDCFPESLSVTRREALIKAYKEKYDPEDIYECPVCIVESEIHMVQALEDIKKAGCDALVVYLGNFGPEISETLLAKHFDGPKMFVAAAEESGDNLLDGRGDAYCGMLNASYNLKLRNIKAYIPEYPVGTAEECADMIHEFLPIARTVKALSELKIISFGPRPLNFLACNAPIKPLYDLGIEIEENSELDLFEAFNQHEGDERIPAIIKEMEEELGAGNKKPEILSKLAQYELTLKDWIRDHKGYRKYVTIAGKCWPAFQTQFGFVPCYVNSRLTAQGIPVSCEVDIYGTLSEFIGTVVSQDAVTLLDINNSVPADLYEEDIKGKYGTYTLKDTIFEVVVPTYRNDITMAADLIEEVARMYGYDNIPSSLPLMEMTKGNLTPKQSNERFVRDVLVDLGLHETLTYTLTSPSTVNDFNLFHPLDEQVKLMSPLGEERSVTRKSVIPSLLQVINYNQSHACKDVCIFEISNTYAKDEITTLAIACNGTYHSVPWAGIHRKVDFYVVKGFVETLFKKLCIEESRYSLVRVEADNKDFHPGRSGYIKMGKEIVGVIGQIHPLKAKKYDIKGETVVAELNLSVLLNLKTKALKVAAIPQYPSVNRDIALVMDKDIPTYDVVRSIQKASKRLISKTEIFDIYEGEHIEEGKKSVAITLTFQDTTKTLEDAIINEVMENILAVVAKEYNAHLRA